MKEKFDVNLIVEFFHMIRTQFGKLIKHLCFADGMEYIAHDISKFLSQNGFHEFTCVDTHNKMTLLKEKISIF